MTRELAAQLAALTKAEKAAVVQRLALEIADVWPGVEKTAGVMGGAACIVRTRIPIWVLENYRRVGWSDARVLANYPSLRAEDVAHAWAYAEVHREEIEGAIHDNEAA